MKRVLITPLNWGLGHATRCIPIIRLLLKHEAKVFIASDGAALKLLKKEFPHLIFFELPGYSIRYPEKGSMMFKMLKQLPALYSAVEKEHRATKKIVRENKIDIIISDNRYGCETNKTYSVFITHQLNIQAPKNFKWLEPLMRKVNSHYIKRFDACWIPDMEGETNLAGKLSHSRNTPFKKYYIGPLSRFEKLQHQKPEKEISKLLILISGPEPQRTSFEKLVLKQAELLTISTNIVCGVLGPYSNYQLNPNVAVHSYMDANEMQKLFNEADLIVSRSGYSTILDLAATGKKAVLIPTPGQTEQLYLAEKFHLEKVFYSQPQNQFDLNDALKNGPDYSGIQMQVDSNVLEERIKRMLG